MVYAFIHDMRWPGFSNTYLLTEVLTVTVAKNNISYAVILPYSQWSPVYNICLISICHACTISVIAYILNYCGVCGRACAVKLISYCTQRPPI